MSIEGKLVAGETGMEGVGLAGGLVGETRQVKRSRRGIKEGNTMRKEVAKGGIQGKLTLAEEGDSSSDGESFIGSNEEEAIDFALRAVEAMKGAVAAVMEVIEVASFARMPLKIGPVFGRDMQAVCEAVLAQKGVESRFALE